MAKYIIHVNRQFIAINAKLDRPVLPTYIVRKGETGKSKYCFGIKADGPFELVDPRERPQLKCGARAWIETDAEPILGEWMTFTEAKKLHEECIRETA